MSLGYERVALAGVFGLTPSLLLNRLQKMSDQYAAEIKGSESAETAAGN